MYKKILIALDNSPADETLLPHVAELAARFESELLLLHVADGFAARCYDQLKLNESEEIKEDRAYHWMKNGALPTESVEQVFKSAGILERFERFKKGEAVDVLVKEAEEAEVKRGASLRTGK